MLQPLANWSLPTLENIEYKCDSAFFTSQVELQRVSLLTFILGGKWSQFLILLQLVLKPFAFFSTGVKMSSQYPFMYPAGDTVCLERPVLWLSTCLFPVDILAIPQLCDSLLQHWQCCCSEGNELQTQSSSGVLAPDSGRFPLPAWLLVNTCCCLQLSSSLSDLLWSGVPEILSLINMYKCKGMWFWLLWETLS